MSDGAIEGIRRVSAELDGLPGETRRFVAAFAYVLARVTRIEPGFSAVERATMVGAVIEAGRLTEPQAELVVEVARSVGALYGATEDFVVTRDFARMATREQREALLRAAFLVGAADGEASAAELAELREIAAELGFDATETEAIRAAALEAEDESR